MMRRERGREGERERERERERECNLAITSGSSGLCKHAKTHSSGLKFDRSSKAWKKKFIPSSRQATRLTVK